MSEQNYWNDRRVRVRPPRHAAYTVDEKRMMVYIERPEDCGEEYDAVLTPPCVCLCCENERRGCLPCVSASEREEAHAEGGAARDEHAVPFKWAVCETCQGKGKHVNPSIDCDGISGEDFAEDPDFAESYMSGVYDVTCSECDGKRVVPELVPRTPEQQSAVEVLDARERADADYEREVRAERAFGC